MLKKIGKKYRSDATKGFGIRKMTVLVSLSLQQHLASSWAVVIVVKVFWSTSLCIIHTAMQNKTSLSSNRNLEFPHCFLTFLSVCRPLEKHTQTQIAGFFSSCHPEHNWIWQSSVYFAWWPSRWTTWYQEMTRGIPEKAKSVWVQDYSLNSSPCTTPSSSQG